MNPGIYTGLSRADYVAIPAFNQSLLKKWIEFGITERCPAKFAHWLKTHDEQDSTDAQTEGQIIDCLLLGPDEFAEKFVVVPAGAPKRPSSVLLTAKNPSLPSIQAMQWWETFNSAVADRQVVSSGVVEECRRMAESLRSSVWRMESGPVVRMEDILRDYRKTVIVAEMCGHLCKAELDLFSTGTKFIFDVKKTRNASNTERTFGSDAIKFGYHIQAPFYMDIATAAGEPRGSFSFLMVEDAEPYPTNAISLVTGDEVVQWGRIQYRAAIESLAAHMESQKWPGYPAFEAIQFPQWARMEADAAINHG